MTEGLPSLVGEKGLERTEEGDMSREAARKRTAEECTALESSNAMSCSNKNVNALIHTVCLRLKKIFCLTAEANTKAYIVYDSFLVVLKF